MEIIINSVSVTAKMPDSLTIGELEAALSRVFKTNGPYPETLILDLSKCEFAEMVALLHLVAIAADRTRHNLITRFSLPKSKDVRDFMRVWEFPTALRDATGIPFSKLVVEEDLTYFGENSEVAVLRYAKHCNYEGSLQRLLSSRFFAITSFLPALQIEKRFALAECGRWRETLVRSVLSRYLCGPDSYVASRIVFEAATNAVRHPGARIIQTGSTFLTPNRMHTVTGKVASIDSSEASFTIETSQGDIVVRCGEKTEYFRETKASKIRSKRVRVDISSIKSGCSVRVRARQRTGFNRKLLTATDVTLMSTATLLDRLEDADEGAETGFLTIAFWDDGESIVDTIKEAIQSGKSIRSIEVPELYADFELLRCDDAGHVLDRKPVNSSYLPTSTTPDDLLLLASTFPGITRDISGAGREKNTEPLPPPIPEAPGMGLFVLLNTVIDVFGGSVFIRTKHLGMSVKKATKQADQPHYRYKAKVRCFDPQTPLFLGNMIVVRMPIREHLG